MTVHTTANRQARQSAKVNKILEPTRPLDGVDVLDLGRRGSRTAGVDRTDACPEEANGCAVDEELGRGPC